MPIHSARHAAKLLIPSVQRRCVSQHGTLNWHTHDHPTPNYYARSPFNWKIGSHVGHNNPSYDHLLWDRYISPVMYGGTRPMYFNHRQIMPMWINEHLFARTYWNANINLYYWSKFKLNFYFKERERTLLRTVFTSHFVNTPRWAYNLVLLYTNHNYWNVLDVGLRMKVMLFVNYHVWLIFKFKMHKIARLNGIERGIKQYAQRKHSRSNARYWERAGWLNFSMQNMEDPNHYVRDETTSDHRQEGAGVEHVRNYAHVSTLAGPDFSREHTARKPWWWHAFPSKRRRWEASNPFGHDLVAPCSKQALPMMHVGMHFDMPIAGLNRRRVSVQK